MSNVLKMLSRGGAAAAETDPNFKQTVLLLHGDGTNGAQNNTFLDSSTNNFTITRNGNTTQGTFSPFSLAAGEWSNYFDGTTDWLEIATNAAFAFGTGDFTIEAWINTNTITGSGNIYDQRSADPQVSIALYRDGSQITFRVNGTNRITAGSLSIGVWHHIALCRSSGSTRLFVDGTQVGSTYADTNSYIQNPVNIGRYAPQNTSFFNGYISNLRAVKGRAVYTSNFTPSTVPLGATSGGTNPPQGTEQPLCRQLYQRLCYHSQR
jgi:hypothetical protein